MRSRVPVAAGAVGLIFGLLAVASGCTVVERSGSSARPVTTPAASPAPSPSSDHPKPHVLALANYLRPRPGFYAEELVVLDAETFQRRASLRLDDAVTTVVVDPTKQLIALGGHNFGKVILVDPAGLEVRGKIEVAPDRGVGSPEVHVVGWSSRDRLLGYAQESAAHYLLPGRAFVADPERAELVRSVALHGSVMAATATPRGVAFLVARVEKVGRARLVLMDEEGNVRSIRLRRIEAGYVDPGSPGESLLRDPALVAVRDAVYVIGASEPLAAVDVRSGSVSYQWVPGLMKARLPGSTNPATGTAGALEVRRREATPVDGARVLVSGDETRVVRGGGHLHEFERVPQIVDLAKRRVRKSFDGLSEVRLAGRIALGRSSDGHLVALRPNGDVLYRRRGGRRSWTVIGGRLVEFAVNGRAAVELDLHTGRVLSELGDVGWWITNAFAWPPKTFRGGEVTLY